MSAVVRILMVEDDTAKASSVVQELEATFGVSVLTFVRTQSVAEAMTQLEQYPFDLLIVDLSLPLRAGSEPVPRGGLRLLEALADRRDLHTPSHIVGLTAYAEIAVEQAQSFREWGWVLTHYDPSSEAWAAPVRRKVAHIIAYQAQEAQHASSYQTDLCVITALEVPELDAVLSLPGIWKRESRPGDVTVYHRTEWLTGGKVASVVAASSNQMGMAAAAALAMKMVFVFRPQLIALCGIAAGVNAGFGDVLIADQVWDAGSGKIIDNESGIEQFAAAPMPVLLDQAIKARIACYVRDGGQRALGSIERAWKGCKPTGRLSAYVGPIASGAAVIASQPYVERMIKTQQRKVIGIEMEGYALCVAGRYADEPRPSTLIIKSVSDIGDKSKSDVWQQYAAYTSAQFLYHLMCEELLAPLDAI